MPRHASWTWVAKAITPETVLAGHETPQEALSNPLNPYPHSTQSFSPRSSAVKRKIIRIRQVAVEWMVGKETSDRTFKIPPTTSGLPGKNKRVKNKNIPGFARDRHGLETPHLEVVSFSRSSPQRINGRQPRRWTNVLHPSHGAPRTYNDRTAQKEHGTAHDD